MTGRTVTGSLSSIAMSMFVLGGVAIAGRWGQLVFAVAVTAVIVAGAAVYAVIWARHERRKLAATPGCTACTLARRRCGYCQHWRADRNCPICQTVTPTADVRGLWSCAACAWPRTTGPADAAFRPAPPGAPRPGLRYARRSVGTNLRLRNRST